MKTKFIFVTGGVLSSLGKGLAAAASIPGNLVQGAVGLVAGFLLMQVARRTHLEEKVSV